MKKIIALMCLATLSSSACSDDRVERTYKRTTTPLLTKDQVMSIDGAIVTLTHFKQIETNLKNKKRAQWVTVAIHHLSRGSVKLPYNEAMQVAQVALGERRAETTRGPLGKLGVKDATETRKFLNELLQRSKIIHNPLYGEPQL